MVIYSSASIAENSMLFVVILIRSILCQLKDRLNSKGEKSVFILNNLLNDCECSKPNSYAISLTDKSVVDNFSLAFSISLS
jgi:hypothetical protein